jgi:hypothetical protein
LATSATRVRARALPAVLVAVVLLALVAVISGWLRAPAPYVPVGDGLGIRVTAGWLIRLGLTVSAALTFVLGPGIALQRHWRRNSIFRSTAFVWIPGTAYLFVVGCVVWILESLVDPRDLSACLLLPVPLWLLWSVWRVGPGEVTTLLNRHQWVTMGVVVVLLLIGVGKASWSSGPAEDLFAGTISRTLEVGNRPDSRIPFHVVQLVAHGTKPYSPLGASYFAPYKFSDRGPIAGITAAPIIFASGARPPVAMPDQPWVPFDAEGFAAYRVVLMLLGSVVLLGVAGVLERMLRPEQVLAGVVLVALTPFVVHEVWFTWPKLFAAAFALAALVALLRRKALLSGFVLGLAYLAHPSAIFAAAGVVLVWLVLEVRGSDHACPEATDGGQWPQPRTIPWLRLVGGLVLIGVGAGVVILAWSIANSGHNHNEFLGYFSQADGRMGVPASTWVSSRMESLGNTLVPLELLLFDRANRSVVAILSPVTPGVAVLGESYWMTVPLGVGLVYFPLYLYALVRFARRSPWLFAAAIAVPFVGFWIYMGSDSSGLIRDGLHFWVVITLLAAFLAHSVWRGAPTRSRRAQQLVRVLLAARAFEVAFMLVGPPIVEGHLFDTKAFVITDVVALTTMFVGVSALAVLTWRWFEPGRCAPVEAPTVRRASVTSRVTR